MPIVPLPVFEADADPRHRQEMSDEEVYARLEPPKSIVVRFGTLGMVAEYPYDGEARPGCGTKLVARTHRGTEVVEMLTTTCENAGCSKTITRQEMLQFIDDSGGKEYPFYSSGKILRVARIEDLNKQSDLDAIRRDAIKKCRSLIAELDLPMKLVDVEPILGGELMTFYYMSEERVDFRELVRRLASHIKTRIEMRQVGARDEARLVADYERCGQHCCCKSFLKVLKPVSMKSAKVQKATLDPLKISGRCGRLMCCLRYEDQTYKELKANLPKKNSRVGTREGRGIVVETKLLVQLALVRLEHDGREIAVPVEELMDPDQCPEPGTPEFERMRAAGDEDALRGLTEEEAAERTDDTRRARGRGRGKGRKRGRAEQQQAYREKSTSETGDGTGRQKERDASAAETPGGGRPKRRRRRRGRGRGPKDGTPREDQARAPEGDTSGPSADGGATSRSDEGQPPGKSRSRRSRSRRRRKRSGGGQSGQPPGGGGAEPADE